MRTKAKLTAIPEHFLPVAGVPDPGTRIYRREGSYDEMVIWFDALCEHIGGCVSPGGAAVYAGVTRAGVYKRLKAGKLTAFCFHITKEKQTLFGGKRLLKEEPLVYIPSAEAKSWRLELEARATRLEKLRAIMEEDEAALEETDGNEADWNHEFLAKDPKDKGRKGVRPPYPWEEIRES